MKMYNELNTLLEEGKDPESDIVKALAAKISGQEVDPTMLTDDAVNMLATTFAYTGKLPSLGRGKEATRIRAKIYTQAAEIVKTDVIGKTDSVSSPTELGLKVISESSDTRAIQATLNKLEPQVAMMGAFVDNIGLQVERFKEVSKGLKTSDYSLFNLPLRAFRARIKGHPQQAKLDMYATEIENEIGKIASGSIQSIAELSQGSQEKWAKIHDKNMSIKKLTDLLGETHHAAGMRYQTMQTAMSDAKGRMARETAPVTPGGNAPQSAINALQQNPELAEQFKAKYGYLPGER